MEGRRTTRGRLRRVEDPTPSAPSLLADIGGASTNVADKRSTTSLSSNNASPARRASPGRTRRSSRPRSAAMRTSESSTTVTLTAKVEPPTPIKEDKESPKSAKKTRSNMMTASASLNTVAPKSAMSRVPIRSATTSSVHSTYSTSTHKTLEIRSTVSELDTEISKLTDFIRRSVSKTITGNKREGTHTPTTNTEVESRYSRSVSRSVYDDDNYSKAEFSDNEDLNGRAKHGNNVPDDEEEEEEQEHYKSFNLSAQHSYSTSALGLRNQGCRQLEIPREFGGWLGATLLMLGVPALTYYLLWCCDENACRFKPPNWDAMLDSAYLVKTVFRGDAVFAFVAFQMCVFVLTATLGGICTTRYFNVLPIALCMTIAAGIAEYLKYPVADFVLENQLRFSIYGFVNAFIVAMWCYMRADLVKAKTATQVNVYGKTGNVLVDYALGRQVNPKWLGFVEFKLVFYRIAMLLTLLYAECYFYKELELPWLPADESGILSVPLYYWHNASYDGAALLTASMLLLYVLEAIYNEVYLATSFELRGEGFGCLLLLRYAATPYLLSAVARYFYEHQLTHRPQAITPPVCRYAVYVSMALLLAGLALKWRANAVKFHYRHSPRDPYFNCIETIHTFQGKRLLLGPLWGRLRQPNYAGDLMALSGLALPLFLRFAWPPLVCLLLLALVLLHRAQRVHAYNLSRYHSSWVRYCNQVRYYVLPHVY